MHQHDLLAITDSLDDGDDELLSPKYEDFDGKTHGKKFSDFLLVPEAPSLKPGCRKGSTGSDSDSSSNSFIAYPHRRKALSEFL